MKTFKIPVTWGSWGIVEVEAETLDEALNKFDRDEDQYPLPEAEYIDGSFEREKDIEIIELNNV